MWARWEAVCWGGSTIELKVKYVNVFLVVVVEHVVRWIYNRVESSRLSFELPTPFYHRGSTIELKVHVVPVSTASRRIGGVDL